MASGPGLEQDGKTALIRHQCALHRSLTPPDDVSLVFVAIAACNPSTGWSPRWGRSGQQNHSATTSIARPTQHPAASSKSTSTVGGSQIPIHPPSAGGADGLMAKRECARVRRLEWTERASLCKRGCGWRLPARVSTQKKPKSDFVICEWV